MIASIFVNKVLDLFLPPHIGLVRLTESTLMVSCSITSKLSVLQNSIQQTPYLTYFHFIGSDPTYPLPAAFLPSFQKQAVPNSTSGSYCFLDDRSTGQFPIPPDLDLIGKRQSRYRLEPVSLKSNDTLPEMLFIMTALQHFNCFLPLPQR